MGLDFLLEEVRVLERVWGELDFGLGVSFARMAFELWVFSVAGEYFDLTGVEREGSAFLLLAKYSDDVMASPTGDSGFLSIDFNCVESA